MSKKEKEIKEAWDMGYWSGSKVTAKAIFEDFEEDVINLDFEVNPESYEELKKKYLGDEE